MSTAIFGAAMAALKLTVVIGRVEDLARGLIWCAIGQPGRCNRLRRALRLVAQIATGPKRPLAGRCALAPAWILKAKGHGGARRCRTERLARGSLASIGRRAAGLRMPLGVAIYAWRAPIRNKISIVNALTRPRSSDSTAKNAPRAQ